MPHSPCWDQPRPQLAVFPSGEPLIKRLHRVAAHRDAFSYLLSTIFCPPLFVVLFYADKGPAWWNYCHLVVWCKQCHRRDRAVRKLVNLNFKKNAAVPVFLWTHINDAAKLPISLSPTFLRICCRKRVSSGTQFKCHMMNFQTAARRLGYFYTSHLLISFCVFPPPLLFMGSEIWAVLLFQSRGRGREREWERERSGDRARGKERWGWQKQDRGQREGRGKRERQWQYLWPTWVLLSFGQMKCLKAATHCSISQKHSDVHKLWHVHSCTRAHFRKPEKYAMRVARHCRA